ILDDDSLYCWGENSFAQLGDGTTSSRTNPTPVIGLSSNAQQQLSDWTKPIIGEATGTTLSTYDDGFIQYYDDSGTLLWSQLIVGNQNETVSSVAIDSEDNVIACGFFWGSADFGDGVQYHSTNFADGFIAKYTQSGTLLWIEKISSGSEFWGRDFDACNSVAVDSEDNIIIGGTYFTYNKPSTVGSMTAPYGISTTGFVARLDSDGTTEWISSHANFTHVRDVAVGPNGDIAIAGDFSRTIEIGGKSFTKSTSGPGAFVAKVDGTTGMLLWTDAVMGASWLYGTAVALTATGEVYFSGQGYYLEFSDGDSVDPGNGHDVYVIKYTENGDMIWKRYFGSDANDGANDLVTDEEGGVLVVGAFGRWIHYGNGQSFGGPWGIGMDVYVARLGPNGDFSWFRNGGGTVSLWRFDGDVGTSMDLGPDGTLHVVGHHFYNASFGDHDIGTDQGRAGFHATMTFDTDGDGVHDSSDSCPGTIPAFVADADGCAPYQLDSDGDGIADNHDQCPGTPAGATVNGLGCEPPTTDETPTCSMYTTTTLGQVETIGVSMETKPEWVSLNYQRALLSEGVYDVGLHCVDPNGDEFSLELVGPVESVQGSGSDVWIVLTDELLKGYETAHRFDYTWTQGTSQENGYAHLILIDPAMATNATKRVALWGGKVNQHWDVDDLEWKTDPDGTSGANIGALATCKKWYPDTAAVELMQHRETITFWTAGNSAPYESTKP
ncbi:MAG: thrombospondin type 3 repeat-containing protein, partial [Candidatus Poseidoniia archaeon]